MKKGKYQFLIHNYDSGHNTGCRIQIEANGQIFDYNYDRKVSGTIVIADVHFDGANFVVETKLEGTTKLVSKEMWGLSSNKFHKVSMLMNSPNFWDGQEIGNKHTFFMLEGCVCDDEKPRGFFNEFLKEEFMEHRHAFDWCGNKLPAERVEKELSGTGFSSTQRNSVVVKVKGAVERLFKVNF